MKVTNHDGTQFHQIGIQPTIPLERSIAGIRAGKDEFLERALTIIKQRQNQ
jgi:C-terminal processing protease CtpA/Prc